MTHALLPALAARMLLFASLSIALAAQTSSAFASGTGGWTPIGASCSLSNPGGYLTVTDLDSGWAWIEAPAAFHDDWTTAMTVSLRVRVPTGGAVTNPVQLEIDGGGGTASYTFPVNAVVAGAWQELIAPLDPSAWVLSAPWSTITTQVDAFRIRLDLSVSSSETCDVDDITVWRVPAPALPVVEIDRTDYLLSDPASAQLRDIAYDANTGRYCAVFDLFLQRNDPQTGLLQDYYSEIWATVFDGTGSLLSTSTIDSEVSVSASRRVAFPTVANANQTGMFVVAWAFQDNPFLFLPPFVRTIRACHLTPAGIAAPLVLANDAVEPDMAGDPSGLDDETVVVWRDFASGGIRAGDLRTNGAIHNWAQITVTSEASARTPAISKTLDSQNGQYAYCVVWSQEDFSPVLGNYQREVYAALINPNMANYGVPIKVSASALVDDELPDVDGDGRDFLVTWQRREITSSSKGDIVCRRITVGAGAQLATAGPEIVVAGAAFVDERAPKVAWTGPRYLLAYQRETSTQVAWNGNPGSTPVAPTTRYASFLSMRNPDGSTASVHYPIDSGNLQKLPQPPLVVGARSGSQAGGNGGFEVAYERSQRVVVAPWPFLTVSEVRTYDLLGLDVPGTGHFGGGAAVDLGGGCGQGGVLSTLGAPALGNPGFGLGLSLADPAASLGLLVAGTGPFVPCGPCALTVPDVYSTFGLAVGGAFSVSLAVPNSSYWYGMQLVWQAAVLPSSGPCPLLPEFAVSNRLQTTFGY